MCRFPLLILCFHLCLLSEAQHVGPQESHEAICIYSLKENSCPTRDHFEDVKLPLEANSFSYTDDETSFPDAPIQLVGPDSQHKKLVIMEQGMRFLASIKQPVATISVVGKYHSGKSFLMNQIMQKSSGFGIGARVTPETLGIWIWGKPLQMTTDKGIQWTLLLDTEGFAANNVSENYDAKIFAVSTLMSSIQLYNSVKIIDQTEIDYLELLARRTQLFSLKAQLTSTQGWADFSNQLLEFPSFLWIVQDFVQNTHGEKCRNWLVGLLNSHTREMESYDISLKDIFPSVDCHTLFIPASEKRFLSDLSQATENDLTEEYRNERNELIRKIEATIQPKIKDNKQPFTGIELSHLLRVLVGAANSGSLASMPNRWDSFLESVQKTAVEDCFHFYKTHLNNLLVDEAKNEAIHCDHFNEWQAFSRNQSAILLSHLLQGLEKSLEKAFPELEELISKYYTMVSEHNKQKIQVKLLHTQNRYETKIADVFLLLSLPMLTPDLQKIALDTNQTVISQFVSEMSYLIEEGNLTSNVNALRRIIQLNVDSTLFRNSKKVEQFFDEIIDNLKKEVFSEVSTELKPPMEKMTISSLLSESGKRTLTAFVRYSEKFRNESIIFQAKLNYLKLFLIEKIAELQTANERAVAIYLENGGRTILLEFDRTLSTHRDCLPIDLDLLKSIIETESKQVSSMFVEKFSVYSDYEATFSSARNHFADGLAHICSAIEKENVNAYRREVIVPLELAKKSILLSANRYSTLFSFRKFSVSVCVLHLADGKAKDWSAKLKLRIIDSFLEEDSELARELKSRNGIFSRFCGFFLWLHYLIFG